MRISVIFENFGPYHAARLEAAHGYMGIFITGIELRSRSRTYEWNNKKDNSFLKMVLPEMPGGVREERRALVPHLEKALKETNPDVVAINGWGDFLSIESINWCVKNQIPFVLMSESTAWDFTRSWHREWIKKQLVSVASAALVGGTPHIEYLELLGMDRDKVFIGYDVVDNDFFKSRVEQYKLQNDTPYFLASNRFVPKKNLLRLIEAYGQYVKISQFSKETLAENENIIWPLVLLGDGELRGELRTRCIDLGLQIADCGLADNLKLNSYKLNSPAATGCVIFAGFRQLEDLPAFYAGAGCFVHSSTTEQWGLVVNEAMASGLPVIISNRCGCAKDLVIDGENGVSFDPFDVNELADCLLKISGMNQESRKKMGIESQNIIKNYSTECFADGLHRSAREALRVAPNSPSIKARLLLKLLMSR